MTAFRTEHDSMGAVDVRSDRYWGAQTQRSLDNFKIGNQRFPRAVIRALGIVKQAAARANASLGKLDEAKAALIVDASKRVEHGELDDHFPLVVWQTGSGTQTNMNANEVIANVANELAGKPRGSNAPIHPNDHVNLSQSSNDVFPTVMHVASALRIHERLEPAVATLARTIDEKSRAFGDIVKVGRTHMMDAVPLTLGQEMSAWSSLLEFSRRRLVDAEMTLLEIAMGGTAVGTGLNSPEEWPQRCAALLTELTGLAFKPAPNFFAALSAHDAMLAASSATRGLATACTKIANDVRLLASGPRTGIGELILPENEPGSSIMPGKVNPTQCEAMTMVCAHVMGLDAAIGFAGASGQLQLNAMKPVILHDLLESVELLADACDSFRERCVDGIEPNRGVIAKHVSDSLMLATALSPELGYDATAKIARDAHARGVTLRDAAIASGKVSGAKFDELVRPENMIAPAASPLGPGEIAVKMS